MKIVKRRQGSVLSRIYEVINQAALANEPLSAIILSDEEWQQFAEELETTVGVLATNGMFFTNAKGMRLRIYKQDEVPEALYIRSEVV